MNSKRKTGNLLTMTIREQVLPDVQTVALVGTGLLGTSIALALRQQGFAGQVIGVGRTQATLDKANQVARLDKISTDFTAAAEADFIILCTPVETIKQQLTALGELLPEQSDPGDRPIITDVGSTKASICAHAAQCLAGRGRFVGSHPMAGSDMAGPDHAASNLFIGKPGVVTPSEDADAQAVASVRELWGMLGMRVMEMSPQQHDERVARVSHLPHLIASLLVAQVERNDGLPLASTGFADTTRIASGLPGLWAEIFTDNREAVFRAIREHQAELETFRAMLEKGDHAEIEAYLAKAKKTRDHWKLGGSNDAIA